MSETEWAGRRHNGAGDPTERFPVYDPWREHPPVRPHFPPAPEDHRGMAAAALALAIISLVIFPLGVLAVILGGAAMRARGGIRPHGYPVACAAVTVGAVSGSVFLFALTLLAINVHP